MESERQRMKFFFRHDDVDQGEWQGGEQTGGFKILYRKCSGVC